MTVREVFEILETLTKEYGVEKVKTTIESMFELLEKKDLTKI